MISTLYYCEFMFIPIPIGCPFEIFFFPKAIYSLFFHFYFCDQKMAPAVLSHNKDIIKIGCLYRVLNNPSGSEHITVAQPVTKCPFVSPAYLFSSSNITGLLLLETALSLPANVALVGPPCFSVTLFLKL